MRGTFKAGVAIAALTGLLIQTTPLMALDDAAAPMALVDSSTAGIVAYSAAYFTDYSPQNALDMVQRIPGFSLNGGDNSRRGLGDSFGNLLVDGQRPSNKSLDLQTVLQRIPAGNVERIDLITEALPQYDMRGHPRLVNVVLKEGAGDSGSWTIAPRLHESGRMSSFGEISFTRSMGEAEVTFGLRANTWQPRISANEEVFDGADALTARRADNDQRIYFEYQPNLSFNLPLGERTSLRGDARYNAWTWSRREVSEVFDPAGDLTRLDLNTTEDEGWLWSATGTLEYELTDSLSSETILLATRESWNEGPGPFQSFNPDGSFRGAIIFQGSGEYEETALRQTLSWNPNDSHALEFGAEAALNARDTGFTLAQDNGTSITAIIVPVSDTIVEESRAEIFATHSWTVNDRLSLESALRWEFSEIAQESFDPNGDLALSQERSFNYPKPSLTLNWQADEETQYRLTARRDVAQLNFGAFASSVNLSDSDEIIGNPDYVPQRNWTLEGEWRRTMGEDATLSFRIGNDWIEDVDDFVELAVANDNGTPNDPSDDFDEVFVAPGNIGDGNIFRLTWEASTGLDVLGLENAQLDAFLEWYNTNITDPVTGTDRNLSNYREWEFRLDFSQSFPNRNLAWGWDYFWLSDGEVFRPSELRNQGFPDGDLDLYIEHTDFFGMTLRAGADMIFDDVFSRERIFYNGSRADGVISGRETREQREGVLFYMRLRDTF